MSSANKTTPPRSVIDTNVWISRFLSRDSIAGRAVDRAIDCGEVLISDATLAELTSVICRHKFRSYFTAEERASAAEFVASIGTRIIPSIALKVCRDPKDDKFLELAISGSATHLITGDRDLLALNPFQKIVILTPAAFLERCQHAC